MLCVLYTLPISLLFGVKMSQSSNVSIFRTSPCFVLYYPHSTMESEFAIRDAVIEDAPAIARVNYLTWLHAYRGLIPDSELDSLDLEFLTEQWNQNLSLAKPRSSTLVVMNGESLIAYSRFYPSADPDDAQDQVATIGSMYVNPDFHSHNIATRGPFSTELGSRRPHCIRRQFVKDRQRLPNECANQRWLS